eukprot:jgi/Hompol1/2154/HPOL_002830-RA
MAVSNLAQQCFIFSDPILERTASEIVMAAGETKAIYVALQPSLHNPSSNPQSVSRKHEKGISTSSANGSSSATSGASSSIASTLAFVGSSSVLTDSILRGLASGQLDCRNLIGGIKFTLQVVDRVESEYAALATKSVPNNPEGLMLLDTQTLKFTATIGQSLLAVSHSLINFGVSSAKISTAPQTRRFVGAFYVYNLSPRLPLEYELRSTSAMLHLGRIGGRIEPTGSVSMPLSVGAESSILPTTNLLASYPSTSTGSTVPSTGDSANSNLPKHDRIEFWFESAQSGFFNEFIEITNLNNSQQQTRIEVRAFLDPATLGLSNVTWLPPCLSVVPSSQGQTLWDSGGEDARHTLHTLQSTGVVTMLDALQLDRPLVKWDNIYASASATTPSTSDTMPGLSLRTLVLQKKHRTDTCLVYERSIEIENLMQELVQIEPQSTLNVAVRWIVGAGSGFVVDSTPSLAPLSVTALATSESGSPSSVAQDHVGLVACGSTLLLHPMEKATAILSVLRPLSVVDEDVWEAVLMGQKLVQEGVLVLQDLDRGCAVKSVDLSTTFCISFGELRPTGAIDVGRVGHFNMWKDVGFSFTIANLAECHLVYEIETPDAIDIVAIMGERDLGGFKRRIEPGGQHHVEAIFKPRKVETPAIGLCTFGVNIFNVFNPRNTMSLAVTATMTQFELRFERLSSGQLDLPAIIHPTPPNPPPCDNWFTIVNITDEDVKFEIGCTLAPDVANLVGVELLSRFSNSPLVGALSLAPRGSIEIKVRASALPKSRLAASETASTYLTNPDGITLGTLWVTSKNSQTALVRSNVYSAASGADSSVLVAGAAASVVADDAASVVSTSSGPTTSATSQQRMTETIPIRGTIVEGTTFSLSHRRITFHSASLSDSDGEENESQTTGGGASAHSRTRSSHHNTSLTSAAYHIQHEDVVVTNPSSHFALEFKVVIEYPIELASGTDKLKLHGLDSDMCGTVDQNSKLVLRVELLDSHMVGVSEDVKLHFFDKNSLSRQLQTVNISIIEDLTGSLKAAKALERTDHDGLSIHPPLGLFEPLAGGESGGIGGEGVRPAGAHATVHWDDEHGIITDSGTSNAASGVGSGLGVGGTIGTSISAQGAIASVIQPSSGPYAHVVQSEDEDMWSSDGRSTLSMGPSAASSRHLSINESISSPVGRRLAGHILLRGCKKAVDMITGEFEGLYELDLGQQDLGQNPVIKKLVVENQSGVRVMYRIGTIMETDQQWMVCSRSEGVLESPRSSSAANGAATSHTITLSFIVTLRGSFSTYMLIENIDNRHDSKIVRVSMEVVAKQNLFQLNLNNRFIPLDPSNNRAFDVFTHGLDWDDAAIDINPAFLGSVYSARSIVICNRESVPLEFSFKSNLSHEDESELVFSLSRTSAKLFRSIMVEPESSSRVFVRFWPGQSMPSSQILQVSQRGDALNSEMTSTATATANTIAQPALSGSYQETGAYGASNGSLSGQPAVEKLIEIYVNCRLVKDYQKIVELRAVLKQPQIMLSSTSFTFSGMIRRKTAPVHFGNTSFAAAAAAAVAASALSEPGSDYAAPSTPSALSSAPPILSPHDPEHDTSPPGYTPAPALQQPLSMTQSIISQSAGSSIIQFLPTNDTFSVTNLLQDTLEYEIVTDSTFFSIELAEPCNIDHDSNEKYILEHMVVYNKRRPSEKYTIHAKLSFGNVEFFHFASGSRRSFHNLESHIIRLVHEIESMPSMYFDSRNLTPEAAEKANNIHFLYLYIVDELIHYGTREQGAEPYLQLSTLLFTMLFSHSLFKEFAPALLRPIPNSVDARVWPINLLRWLEPFVMLMGFFPHRLIAIEPLKLLARSLIVDPRRVAVTSNGSGSAS